MNRPFDEELISAYLDDELSPEEAARVSRRLMEDPAYQQRLGQLQKAWDLLDTLPRGGAESGYEFRAAAAHAGMARD